MEQQNNHLKIAGHVSTMPDSHVLSPSAVDVHTRLKSSLDIPVGKQNKNSNILKPERMRNSIV